MSYAPPLLVPAIPRTALPFGLFSVLTPRDSSDVHWQNGIEWEPLTCAPAGGRSTPDCADPQEEPIGLPKEFESPPETPSATPFTVYGSFLCGPTGHSIEYGQERALEHLLAREEARVEQALWTGDLGNNDYLTGAVDAGDFDSLPLAVGALEKWIATEYGSLGVLHADRSVATALLEKGLVKPSGSTLYTLLGINRPKSPPAP